MGLFKDDFYSTKVTKRSRSKWGFPNHRGSTLIALASLLVGVVMTTLIMLPLVNHKPSGVSPFNGSLDSPTMADLQQNLNDLVIKAVENVDPAIVGIISGQKNEEDDIFELGMGSGVIFEIDGKKARIVTNNHVIDHANEIEIVLHTGERRQAEVIGSDMLSDLAVLEVEASGIEYAAEFGDSDQLKKGETAIAMGNPLGLGFSNTTTVGVISFPHRTIPISLGLNQLFDWEMDAIQTDAAINFGNSGGALVNLEGKVIGINSMKVADTGVEGLGFAIPINAVKSTIDSLIQYGKVMRPLMGVQSEDVQNYDDTEALNLPDDIDTGVVVIGVSGPALDADLQMNDVIVGLDDEPIDSTLLLRKYLYEHKAIGDKVTVHFYRDGDKKKLELTLSEAGN